MATCTADGEVWYTWYDSGTTSATSQCYSTEIWDSWTTDYTVYGTTSTTAVWYRWIEGSPVYIPASDLAPKQTEAQRAEQDRVAEENRQKWKKAEEDRKTAEEKAKQLLLDIIGEDQFKVFEKTGLLLVKGRKYDYLINKEARVKRLEKDKVVPLCIHPDNPYSYPNSDRVVAAMLNAKFREDEFNKTANKIGSNPLTPIKECANY
jgi:hypothetical protein